MGKRKVNKSELTIQAGGDTLTIEQREKSWLLSIAKKSIGISNEAMSKFMSAIKDNIHIDGSFNGKNPETLMRDYSYLVDSKRYAGKVKKTLSLYTDVLSSSNEISDKMEIFYLKRDSEPTGLYASIKRWKGEKESKIEVILNEKILTRLVTNEPPKKKKASDVVAEGIKEKSNSTPHEANEKVAEQEIPEGIDKVYANMLFQDMMQKSCQYCASCNGSLEPHRTDCVQADPLKFMSFHIVIANVNLMSLGRERLSELIIEQLKPSCIDFTVCKINELFTNLSGNGEWSKSRISMYLLHALGIVKDQLIIHL